MELGARLVQGWPGYQWERVRRGQSGAAVYRGTGPRKKVLYAKQGGAAEMTAEVVRLQWLASRVAAPRVVQYGGEGRRGWFVMTALDGQCAEDCREGETLRTVGAWLRELHEWPVEDCPFVGVGLEQARRNVAAGRVDEDDFDAERQGWTAAEVLVLLERTRPRREDRVVTHGDFTLENVLVKGGRATGGRVMGMLDVGRLGVGDRYQDLALVTRGLSKEEERELLAGYGITRLERRKVEYYRCMDELL